MFSGLFFIPLSKTLFLLSYDVYSQLALTYQQLLQEILKVGLKLYCGYKYTRTYMINRILGLKQLWLQLNGYAWFHLYGLRWPVRNGEGAKNSKWKYMVPAGFEPTPRQSTTGKSALQTTRPSWLNIKWHIIGLSLFWYMNTNGYVTIPVWNRLWFDTQCKVL